MDIEGRMISSKPAAPTSDCKLYMGGIPPNIDDVSIKKICEAFGRLKSFNIVKEPDKPNSNKGFAFFEYFDEKSVEKAIHELNGFEIGDKKLKVQKANSNLRNQPSLAHMSMHFYTYVPTDKKMTPSYFVLQPSKVVQFLNIVIFVIRYRERMWWTTRITKRLKRTSGTSAPSTGRYCQ